MSNLGFFESGDSFSASLKLPPGLLVQALEAMLDGVILTDRAGKILYANPATSQLFGASLKELCCQNSIDRWVGQSLSHEGRSSGLSPQLLQQATTHGWRGELRCCRKDGHEFLAEASVGSIPDQLILVWTIRDITNYKRTELELIVENQALARSSQLKSEFLANMSHELRTPLTSILGFSSILKQKIFGELTAKQELYIQQIHRSGQHLLALINDILDLSKIEAGQLSLEMMPLSISQICQEAVALISEQAKVRNLNLQTAIPDDLPPLMADEVRIRQMLLNLLSNAIKFSHEGGTIGIQVTHDHQVLGLTVWDNGIGIPQEKQHLLFNPFQQVDDFIDRRRAGTGLGLALTRRLAELHCGSVEFKSEVGKGSQFTIFLPFQSPQHSEMSHSNPYFSS
ncbi:PAS domain-containing sensor histidine kinase [Alkalinema sp. FACHB-956]|uniref:PAS domain-containing sensor histidine kinase n=1 Tax=Alkalinema sp. FACHB-956 TaxID=2692768 RepID=UPI001689B0CB|nr:PAS domain-containing sensor histidine kinase [Alkalinema sp. FACHB-956]MBD2326858.1 PAS domain-containing sensor histidine kinase [Alkalinema sp. FACHB-956]